MHVCDIRQKLVHATLHYIKNQKQIGEKYDAFSYTGIRLQAKTFFIFFRSEGEGAQRCEVTVRESFDHTDHTATDAEDGLEKDLSSPL